MSITSSIELDQIKNVLIRYGCSSKLHAFRLISNFFGYTQFSALKKEWTDLTPKARMQFADRMFFEMQVQEVIKKLG